MKFVRTFALCLLALLWVVPTASAYKLMPSSRPYAGPTITYYNATKYTSQMRTIQSFINTHNMGVRVQRVSSAKAAQIVIRYGPRSAHLHCGGGKAGLGGPGGLIIATNCNRMEAMAVMAHEFGHTLGLAHEDGRCAVMNSLIVTAPGGSVRPKHCARAFDYFKTPYLADDIKGIRARFVNYDPVAKLSLDAPSIEQGDQSYSSDMSDDPDGNIVWRSMNWGDGSALATQAFRPGWSSSNWAGTHVYALPGVFTATLTVRDSYGKTSTMTASITIVAVPDVCPNVDGLQKYVPDDLTVIDGQCVAALPDDYYGS